MKPSRKLNRRSFLAQVAGGAVGAGALGLIHGEAWAYQVYTGVTDRDEGALRDGSGYGRGGTRPQSGGQPEAGGAPLQQPTGITDSDTGSNSDNAGYGRGGQQAISDNDPTDPAGQGRNVRNRAQPPQTGVTDGDPTDPVGAGRGGSTGYSDSDSGANADPSGRGQRGRPTQTGITDRDPTDSYGQGQGTTGARGERPRLVRPDGTPVDYTGITDGDTGEVRDPAGYGRGSRDCRDSDHSNPDWRLRDPVRRCE